MCEGNSYHMRAPATSNSRKSDGSNKQTFGGRGQKSVNAEYYSPLADVKL